MHETKHNCIGSTGHRSMPIDPLRSLVSSDMILVRLRNIAGKPAGIASLERCMETSARSALIIGSLLLGAMTATAPALAQALTKVRVVLNFAADGGAAGFYHALERGYFRDLSLDVDLEPSKGSADAITQIG